MRAVAALALGLLAALAVAGLPASASDATVAAVSNTGWNPPSVAINPGEKITWSNGTGFPHNVCVAAAGSDSGCGEYRSGDPSPSWPSEGYSHVFATAGTYKYICEQHVGMKGTITVGTSQTTTPSGTGTSTTPSPDTQPTDTITVPTEIEQNTVTPDTTKPSFVSGPKRRASRKSLMVTFSSSEDATLEATVFRRPPRGRSFSRISEASLRVQQGRNVVTLPRKARGALRSGSYRVRLQLADAAGNTSAVKTLSFKIA